MNQVNQEAPKNSWFGSALSGLTKNVSDFSTYATDRLSSIGNTTLTNIQYVGQVTGKGTLNFTANLVTGLISLGYKFDQLALNEKDKLDKVTGSTHLTQATHSILHSQFPTIIEAVKTQVHSLSYFSDFLGTESNQKYFINIIEANLYKILNNLLKNKDPQETDLNSLIKAIVAIDKKMGIAQPTTLVEWEQYVEKFLLEVLPGGANELILPDTLLSYLAPKKQLWDLLKNYLIDQIKKYNEVIKNDELIPQEINDISTDAASIIDDLIMGSLNESGFDLAQIIRRNVTTDQINEGWLSNVLVSFAQTNDAAIVPVKNWLRSLIKDLLVNVVFKGKDEKALYTELLPKAITILGRGLIKMTPENLELTKKIGPLKKEIETLKKQITDKKIEKNWCSPGNFEKLTHYHELKKNAEEFKKTTPGSYQYNCVSHIEEQIDRIDNEFEIETIGKLEEELLAKTNESSEILKSLIGVNKQPGLILQMVQELLIEMGISQEVYKSLPVVSQLISWDMLTESIISPYIITEFANVFPFWVDILQAALPLKNDPSETVVALEENVESMKEGKLITNACKVLSELTDEKVNELIAEALATDNNYKDPMMVLNQALLALSTVVGDQASTTVPKANNANKVNLLKGIVQKAYLVLINDLVEKIKVKEQDDKFDVKLLTDLVNIISGRNVDKGIEVDSFNTIDKILALAGLDNAKTIAEKLGIPELALPKILLRVKEKLQGTISTLFDPLLLESIVASTIESINSNLLYNFKDEFTSWKKLINSENEIDNSKILTIEKGLISYFEKQAAIPSANAKEILNKFKEFNLAKKSIKSSEFKDFQQDQSLGNIVKNLSTLIEAFTPSALPVVPKEEPEQAALNEALGYLLMQLPNYSSLLKLLMIVPGVESQMLQPAFLGAMVRKQEHFLSNAIIKGIEAGLPNLFEGGEWQGLVGDEKFVRAKQSEGKTKLSREESQKEIRKRIKAASHQTPRIFFKLIKEAIIESWNKFQLKLDQLIGHIPGGMIIKSILDAIANFIFVTILGRLIRGFLGLSIETGLFIMDSIIDWRVNSWINKLKNNFCLQTKADGAFSEKTPESRSEKLLNAIITHALNIMNSNEEKAAQPSPS